MLFSDESLQLFLDEEEKRFCKTLRYSSRIDELEKRKYNKMIEIDYNKISTVKYTNYENVCKQCGGDLIKPGASCTDEKKTP